MNIIFDVICPLKLWHMSEIAPHICRRNTMLGMHMFDPERRGQYERETKPKIKIEGDVSLQMCYSFQPYHVNIFGKI